MAQFESEIPCKSSPSLASISMNVGLSSGACFQLCFMIETNSTWDWKICSGRSFTFSVSKEAGMLGLKLGLAETLTWIWKFFDVFQEGKQNEKVRKSQKKKKKNERCLELDRPNKVSFPSKPQTWWLQKSKHLWNKKREKISKKKKETKQKKKWERKKANHKVFHNVIESWLQVPSKVVFPLLESFQNLNHSFSPVQNRKLLESSNLESIHQSEHWPTSNHDEWFLSDANTDKLEKFEVSDSTFVSMSFLFSCLKFLFQENEEDLPNFLLRWIQWRLHTLEGECKHPWSSKRFDVEDCSTLKFHSRVLWRIAFDSQHRQNRKKKWILWLQRSTLGIFLWKQLRMILWQASFLSSNLHNEQRIWKHRFECWLSNSSQVLQHLENPSSVSSSWKE